DASALPRASAKSSSEFPEAQSTVIAPAKSSDTGSLQKSPPPEGRPVFATCPDEVLPRDYFFNHATTATMRPITLKIDIKPAGITLAVRTNFGTNCTASKSETTNAVARPINRCEDNNDPAMSNNTPVIAPAMIDGRLPAFT